MHRARSMREISNPGGKNYKMANLCDGYFPYYITRILKEKNLYSQGDKEMQRFLCISETLMQIQSTSKA